VYYLGFPVPLHDDHDLFTAKGCFEYRLAQILKPEIGCLLQFLLHGRSSVSRQKFVLVGSLSLERRVSGHYNHDFRSPKGRLAPHHPLKFESFFSRLIQFFLHGRGFLGGQNSILVSLISVVPARRLREKAGAADWR
jgi:hypothetical protein